jgi:hypothetical protein
VIDWRRRKLEPDTVLLSLPFQINALCYGNLDDVLLDEFTLPSLSLCSNRVQQTLRKFPMSLRICCFLSVMQFFHVPLVTTFKI